MLQPPGRLLPILPWQSLSGWYISDILGRRIGESKRVSILSHWTRRPATDLPNRDYTISPTPTATTGFSRRTRTNPLLDSYPAAFNNKTRRSPPRDQEHHPRS
jgi:hypothetical protein